ncbi:NDxxF motif lipoprotein [Staphylococcus cohnii]|uniref:NDxxF motif lipoprotein n=1 Tax=Staphylococcus cohnii TaxID=29382 RepID=UPI00374EDCB6
MKKSILITLVLMLTVILTACANGDSNGDKQHSERHAPSNVKKVTENDIFDINKKGENISEAEMNKAIKKYLDVNSDILDNKYLLQYKLDKQTGTDTKITDAQAKRLSDLSHNAVKNDVRFKKFVKDNHLPKGYKDDVDRIINYFTALNTTIKDADKQIEEVNYQPQNKLNVVDVPAENAGNVNGKKQEKIKKFLEDKGIKSDAIDK